MPYPTTFRGHLIQSPYGRAYWHGWHYYLKTPGWKPQRCKAGFYNTVPRRKAFWAGYDMAKQATLRCMTSYHGHVDVTYRPGGLY